MLIDKKGKLFGKLSIVDLVIIFSIIVIAVGAYLKFGPDITGATPQLEVLL